MNKRDIANKETLQEKNPELLIIKYFSPIRLSFLNVLLFPQLKLGYIFVKMQIRMMTPCRSTGGEIFREECPRGIAFFCVPWFWEIFFSRRDVHAQTVCFL